MAVVARFFVQERTQFAYNKGATKVKLVPVVGRTDENKSWAAATPSGSIEMHINNPTAAEAFEIGVEYEIVFTKIEA